MAFDPGAIDATLAAAVGDAPDLIAELHQAFREGAARHARDLAEARDAAAWQDAAARLGSLAASFGAVRLLALARKAAEAPTRDARAIRAVRRAIDRL